MRQKMNLDYLFYPKSIAVVGASRDASSVGNNIVRNLVTQGYRGKLFLVNPKAERLYGKKVYGSLAEIEEEIELAVIAVPARLANEVTEELVKRVRAIVIVSSGFKESGESFWEEELKKTCRLHNVLLIGPNCLGVINPEIKMNCSFANIMPRLGNIAFISQSGAICTTVIDYAQDLGLGFSKFISIGNKAGVDELQLLQYLAKDARTKLIAIYTEELNGAAEIIKITKAITQGNPPKPVIVLKSGKTDLGAKAVSSHTGALSGSNEVYEALFAQAGIIRANTIQELFNYMQIFSKNGLTQIKNVAVITNAGGPGVIATDEIANCNLSLAKFSVKTKKDLKLALPAAAHIDNPVDILGDAGADRYDRTLKIVEKDKKTDCLLVLLTPQSMTQIKDTAKEIIELKARSKKPITACFMGKSTVEPAVSLMKTSGVTAMNFPEPAVRKLSVFGQFYKWSKQPQAGTFKFNDADKNKARSILSRAKKDSRLFLSQTEALEILKAYQFPLLKFGWASNVGEVETLAKKFKEKMAMKIVSPDILHKSDVGGVVLNVEPGEGKKIFVQLTKSVSEKKPKAKLEGVLLEEMAPKNGIETILGAKKNSNLGTTIMFGMGGVYVEVLKDVSFGIVPITPQDAKRMVESLKASKIFAGFRGMPCYDVNAVINCLGRLSQLLTDFPEIKELDINPLLVLPKGEGVRVLDARIIIE